MTKSSTTQNCFATKRFQSKNIYKRWPPMKIVCHNNCSKTSVTTTIKKNSLSFLLQPTYMITTTNFRVTPSLPPIANKFIVLFHRWLIVLSYSAHGTTAICKSDFLIRFHFFTHVQANEIKMCYCCCRARRAYFSDS